jgi:hypothetical protein
MARTLGVVDYPQPSGGCCYLADENFAKKFMDKLSHPGADGKIGREELILLKVGRHFRLSPSTKVIVGRDEGENNFLDRFLENRWSFRACDHVGPVAVLDGEADEESIRAAARITARYCDGRMRPSLRIEAAAGGERRVLDVTAATDAELESIRL